MSGVGAPVGSMKNLAKAVERKLDGNRAAEFSLWDWWKRKPWRRAVFVAILTVTVAVTLLILGLVIAGELGNFYRWLVDQTNAGQQWTDWMREHPRVFPLAAFAVFIVLGGVLVPWRLWPPVYLTSFLLFFLGFLGGHVYW